jgi:hypothetical protein
MVPHQLDLRVVHCQALRAADKNAESYAAALAALELPALPDDEDRERTSGQLIGLIDRIGWEAVPESVRKPGPHAVLTLDVVIGEVRPALERFPRSGVVRQELARLLVKTGGVEETNEAVELLTEGLELALNPEQRAEFAKRLTAIKSDAATVSIRASIRQMVEPAEEQRRTAIQEYVQNANPETKQAALAAIRAAIEQITEARRIAEQATLADESASLEEKLDQLRQMAAELDDEEG